MEANPYVCLIEILAADCALSLRCLGAGLRDAPRSWSFNPQSPQDDSRLRRSTHDRLLTAHSPLHRRTKHLTTNSPP